MHRGLTLIASDTDALIDNAVVSIKFFLSSIHRKDRRFRYFEATERSIYLFLLF